MPNPQRLQLRKLLDQAGGQMQLVPHELRGIQRAHARFRLLADVAHLLVGEGQVDFLILEIAAGRNHPHAIQRQAVVGLVIAPHILVEVDALARHGIGDVLDLLEDLEQLRPSGHPPGRTEPSRFSIRTSSMPSSISTCVRCAVVVDVVLLLLALDLVERRLGDVDVAALDQLRHLPVEERQQQRADVRAVHVGIGHDDDLVVAHLGDVELVGPDARADRRDHRADFLVVEHLVEARLLHVEHLAAQRQDRLELAVAALLGRAAGASRPPR